MGEPEEKIVKIKRLIDGIMEASKKRGSMYGSLEVLESMWQTLDLIFFVLNDIESVGTDLGWNYFIASEKGFGTTASISSIVKGINYSEDPYVVLTKLREEYEAWRDEKIKRMKAENVKDG